MRPVHDTVHRELSAGVTALIVLHMHATRACSCVDVYICIHVDVAVAIARVLVPSGRAHYAVPSETVTDCGLLRGTLIGAIARQDDDAQPPPVEATSMESSTSARGRQVRGRVGVVRAPASESVQVGRGGGH
jgi:hypothetical protein